MNRTGADKSGLVSLYPPLSHSLPLSVVSCWKLLEGWKGVNIDARNVMWGLVRSTWHTILLDSGQGNRNKHFVKTLLHLEDIFFDGLTILVNELNKFFFQKQKTCQYYHT